MLVSPINNNNNNFTFQAINEKYYNRAVKDISKQGHVDGFVLYRIGDDVAMFKTISPQDGVDTLKAIRALIDKKKHSTWVDWINELIGEFKQLAKQERIEQRRLLKKELKRSKIKG